VRISYFGRFALSSCVAAAMLAGCGGSQPPIGAPGAMPQSRAITKHADRSGSWMLPEAKGQDLIYAVSGCGGTCVLSASGHGVVGNLNEYGEAACSDKAGNVFIVQNGDILEYAHGGTTPIADLSLPGDIQGGCSVDPTTNNLAVISAGTSIDTDVAVFPNEGGTPTLYTSHIESLFCGYDANGNLFVDGYGDEQYALTMLSKGSSSFSPLSMPQSMGQPGQLQWDGTYMTYEARFRPIQVSRFTVSGSTVDVVGVTKFPRVRKFAVLSWIHGGRIFVPYPSHGIEAKQLGEWKYPQGGEQIRRLDFGSYKDLLDLQAVTYSPAAN
jgi:hypothetical protein